VPGFGRQRADHLVMVRVWCYRQQGHACGVWRAGWGGAWGHSRPCRPGLRVGGPIASACHRCGAGPAGRVGVAGWSGSSSRQPRAHLPGWSRSRQEVDVELVAAGIGHASPPEAFQLAGGTGLKPAPAQGFDLVRSPAEIVDIRSRCSRFLPALASGTRWKPIVRPSFEGDNTTNWPSQMVVSTVTSSGLAQKVASRSGAVVSMTGIRSMRARRALFCSRPACC
jgi:hypothetical protein